MNKVLIIEAINNTPHIETAFELANNEIKKGNLVYFRFIGHALPFNFSWALKRKRRCWNTYLLPETRGAKLIKGINYRSVLVLFLIRNKMPNIEKLTNINEIKELKYNETRIGLCIRGDYLYERKSYEINSKEDKKLVKMLIQNTILVCKYVQMLHKKHLFDAIYTFNGRFTFAFPIAEFCKINNISFGVHERGPKIDKYYFDKILPQDLSSRAKKFNCNETLSKIDLEKAEQFFLNKRKGIETAWISFLKDTNFQKVKLPDRTKKNVVFFSSSDFELDATSDFFPKTNEFENQIQVVEALADFVKELDYRLVVRIHPNMNEFEYYSNELYDNIVKSGGLVYKASDELNSYDLLDVSDIVVTYGSTIGIEAVFWGKPSILAGSALYEGSKDVLGVTDRNELYEALRNINFNFPIDKQSALIYANNYLKDGINFSYYFPNSLTSGYFFNKNLQKPFLLSFIQNINNKLFTIKN